MTSLREAAQAVLNEYERLAGLRGMPATEPLFEALRAALSQEGDKALPAPFPQDLPEMRAQFIETMTAAGCPEHWTFGDDGTGGFHNHATEWAWIAWQRARAVLRCEQVQAAALASPPSEREAPKPFGWFYELDATDNPKAGPVWLGTDQESITATVAADEGMKPFPLYAALPQGVPSGLVLVPVEPTEEMHAAAVRTLIRCTGNDDFPPRVWRAMLAARPTPSGSGSIR